MHLNNTDNTDNTDNNARTDTSTHRLLPRHYAAKQHLHTPKYRFISVQG